MQSHVGAGRGGSAITAANPYEYVEGNIPEENATIIPPVRNFYRVASRDNTATSVTLNPATQRDRESIGELSATHPRVGHGDTWSFVSQSYLESRAKEFWRARYMTSRTQRGLPTITSPGVAEMEQRLADARYVEESGDHVAGVPA